MERRLLAVVCCFLVARFVTAHREHKVSARRSSVMIHFCQTLMCETSGSHTVEYEDDSFLG